MGKRVRLPMAPIEQVPGSTVFEAERSLNENGNALDSNPFSDVTLAILAGGEGSRIGIPKGELRVGAEPILRYLLGRFEWPGPTLLVTAPGRERPPGWESFTREVSDPVGGLGPLRGVLTAIEAAATEHILVAPVDMPGLAAGQLRWLASAFNTERLRRCGIWGLMTCREDSQGAGLGSRGRSERRIEPFPAVFYRDATSAIRARLEAGRGSVHELADDPGLIVVPAPDSWSEGTWINLNRPTDLQTFLATAPENPKSEYAFPCQAAGREDVVWGYGENAKEHVMKLRIRGNSIRLRLGRGEVAKLLETGKVEEATEFGALPRFEYALLTSSSVASPSASFRDGRIEVLLPKQLARDWAGGSDVGISADQPLGVARERNAGSLHVLIEKDFACIKAPPDEDQADAFPHPDEAECKADE